MSWIVVPNWDKFQHYKDRNPVWMKLYFELNSRDDWRALSFAQRGLLVSIWVEYGRSNGLLRVKTLWQRVGQRVDNRTMEALIHAGFIRVRARRPLALARSRDVEVLRTSTRRKRRPATKAAADASPEQEETNDLPEVDIDALEKIKELQANLFRSAP